MPCSCPALSLQPGRSSKARSFLTPQFPLWLALALSALQPAHADTFYVRVDGGDAVECTGRSDAPYPGNGSAQDCAWKHPFFALAPDGTRRIAGGDTLRIGSGSYMMGQGAPGAGTCLPANCYMPPIPSGTGNATTRILGDANNPPKLWGTLGTARILNLDGSSNIEIGHLDITDQDDCVYNHSNGQAKCPAVGVGMWGKYGVYARASRNAWLHDVDIHGLGHSGLWAGGLTDWTMERVKINRNGRAGWDANIGTGASNSGTITLRNVEIGWNGCGERWQTGQAWACWGQQSGGYGDGVGTVATAGQWLIEDVFVHHNTQDGLDLRFLDGAAGTHATLRRVYAVANAGNQIKVKGNSLVENSVLIGNCGYFNGQYFMQAADLCRADGTVLLLVFTANDEVVVRHNTIAGEGWSLIGATEGDASGHALIQNNALIGFPWFLSPANLSRVQGGSSPAIISHVGNLVWNVYGNACPGDSLCGQHPQLKDMALASFDAEPLPGSPLTDKVSALAEVANDFVLTARPQGAASDIGAYELPQSDACVRSAPTFAVSGSTAAVSAGSTVTYTLALTNNDGNACASTRFSLARWVPAGWNGDLVDTSLTLAPGASGGTTLSVTSDLGASPGEYTIGAGTSSNVGSVHTANDSIVYTVSIPQPVCTHAAPTLRLNGSTAPVPAGTAIDYTLALTNNDSDACSATDFSLAFSVPNDWSGSLDDSSVNLAPGANGSTTLHVTSAGAAAADGYNIGAGAGSSVGSVHTASDTIAYNVAAPPPVCTRATPTLMLSGSTAAVPAGTAVTYTLTLSNNDSSACAAQDFSLAASVPADWTGTLGATGLNVAPGANANTTLTVISANDAAANSYTIGAGTSSSVGAVHTASDTIAYTVADPPPVCTRAAPTIGLSGSTAAVPAGSTVVYTLAMTNNDSVECAASSFSLSHSVPVGWSGTLGSASLNLTPGASSSTTLSVTSTANAVANTYAIGASAGSSAGAVHDASTSILYTVSVPPPVCTRAAPTISLTGSTASVPAGSTIGYTLAVTNNDSAACTSTSFNLARTVPAGWTGSLGNASLSLAPGANGSTTLSVVSASTATAGGYSIGASAGSNAGAVHNVSTEITYTVAVPAVSLTTDVSTDKAIYPRGDLVRIQALVRNNGAPIVGTTVTFTITRPAGGNIVQTAVSGSDGIARTNYRLNKSKTAAGQYRVQATWSLSGVAGSGTATFISQ